MGEEVVSTSYKGRTRNRWHVCDAECSDDNDYEYEVEFVQGQKEVSWGAFSQAVALEIKQHSDSVDQTNKFASASPGLASPHEGNARKLAGDKYRAVLNSKVGMIESIKKAIEDKRNKQRQALDNAGKLDPLEV